MWTYNYNYSDELYHYGIKGMKWGIRRKSDTSAGVSRRQKSKTTEVSGNHKPTKIDESIYGKRGAQRIADSLNKGDSRKKAVGKELVRQALLGATAGAAASAVAFDIGSGGELSKSAAKGIASLGKKAVDSIFNGQVLDANGNVIKRYRQTVKFVDEVSSVALTRR